jgi:thiamine-monophosphate kinase
MAISSIPIAEEVLAFSHKYGLNSEEFALFGGEEYELVLTIRPENWIRAKELVNNLGGHLIPIGKVIEDPKVISTSNHCVREIPARGWEHFKTS